MTRAGKRKKECVTVEFHEKHLKENKDYYEKELARMKEALEKIAGEHYDCTDERCYAKDIATQALNHKEG